MPSTTFKHIPLARPAEQIRLLKLQPGTGVIRLEMKTHELTKSPAYVALSYEWGNDSEMHDIVIDGAVFRIRQNLRDALEHIRILQADRSSTRLFDEDSPHFWIDAITIDQSNEAEKAHQVSVMGSIFRQASHVIAWLGLEQHGDDSALAMKHMSTVIGPGESYCQPFPTFSAMDEAIDKICDRSYFQRIWIVQECVLAKKLHLLCGRHYCSWERLYKCNSSRPNALIHNIFANKKRFERNWVGESIQRTMVHILGAAWGRKCSQFHDRIYGLLGILQQSFGSTGIVVDYTISHEELMIRTEEFVTSDPDDYVPTFPTQMIQSVFEQDFSTDVLGKVAWYWRMNDAMHKLDAEVIKGFHRLETLGGEKERALTFHTICWIAGGYGVDLFSPLKGGASLSTATAMPTISLKTDGTIFNVQSRYTIGILTYCIGLKHCPSKPFWHLDDYKRTESESWECRSLLETYSKHVKILGRMRESVEASTTVSDLQTQMQLPIQVEWMVFANLLAQHFLSKCSDGNVSRYRNTGCDGFVRRVEPEGKDLGTFLTESLFSKYRMRVAETPDELPANALKSVETEITSSNEADHSTDFGKKILVAALYDNDA